tara:strand:- start:1191 stop:1538 length:348 start_codon:yes stop_codon:yes gene_type:complete
MSDLKDKTAIITGSTSGIGLGLAQGLAGAGVNILMNGFGDKDEIEAARADLDSKGVKAIYHGADMTQPDEIEDLIKTAHDEFGSVDILVNNADIQHVAPVEDFPPENGTPSSPSI